VEVLVLVLESVEVVVMVASQSQLPDWHTSRAQNALPVPQVVSGVH
jgi:hypothetical protein